METFRIETEIVRVLYDYEPNEDGRLALAIGDVVWVVKRMENGWWDGITKNCRGWFPSNFVTSPEIVLLPPMKSLGWVVRKTRDNMRIYHNTLTGESLTVRENGKYAFDEISETDGDDKQKLRLDMSFLDSSGADNGNVLDATGPPSSKDQSNLPVNWGMKTTPDGRVYYYNMLTNETTWSINDVDVVTGSLRVGAAVLSPMAHSHLSVNQDIQFDTNSTTGWDRFYVEIADEITILRDIIASKEKSRYLEQTSNIVMTIQRMLTLSETLDKDSSVLKSHKMLGIHHRNILKALSKLVLSAKQASGVWPPPDSSAQMRSDTNEVLLAARHFTSTAKDSAVDIHMETPEHYEEGSSTTTGFEPRKGEKPPVYGSDCIPAQTLMSGIDAAPRLITDAIVKLHEFVKGREDAGSGAELIAFTRDIVTEVGQFLSLIEDIDTSPVTPDIVTEFDRYKENLYNSIRSLVASTTAAVEPLPNVDALDQVTLYSSSVETAVNDLVISAKYVLEEKNLMNNLDIPYESAKDRALSLEPRRALSMNHLSSSVPKNKPSMSESLESTTEEEFESRSMGKVTRFPLVSRMTNDDRMTKSGPVSPAAYSDIANMLPVKASNVRKFKPRKIATSAPIPRRVTVSGKTSTKLSKFFGNELATSTIEANEVDEQEWFLGFDHSPKDMLLSMEGQVKGASLPALVERMTAHDAYDANLTHAFLLTYRTFTDAAELFDLLKQRFNISPPSGLTEAEVNVWIEKKQKPVRLRVFNILKTWLDGYFIHKDANILDEVREFARSIVRETMPLASDQLLKLTDRRISDPMSHIKKIGSPESRSAPNPVLPRSLKRFKLLDVDPMELARQLTLMESHLYLNITPLECLGKAWSDKENNRAPNISAMINLTNHITGWVAECILLEKDIKKRCAVMKYFIIVGDRCRALRNYNGLMAILAALNSSPIHRLKRTKELLSTKTRA
eukprot:Partr_v1_DN28301_c0_g1_i5_m78717 putative Cell division control protein